MTYNLFILNKEQSIKFCKLQFLTIFAAIVLAMVLAYDKYSPLASVVSFLILYFYSYFAHILAHYFPMQYLNLHLLLHHNHGFNTDTFNTVVNWIFEVGSNTIMFTGFYLIKLIFNLTFIPDVLIFYYAFIYISVHNINYTIFHADANHVIHHDTKNSNCIWQTRNYGPDILDHLFGTNGDDKFECYFHMIPNVLVAFLLSYYLFKHNDIVKFKDVFVIFLFYSFVFITYNILKNI